MSLSEPRRVSEAEFLSWPETTNKIELLDGDVVRSPAPTYGHQAVVLRIAQALGRWAESKPVTVGIAPCDIRFAPNRILQPDVFVIFERIPLDHAGPLTTIPALCVEVISSRAPYDRWTKRLVYAAAGVRELWTVHVGGRVERWTGAGLGDSEILTDRLRTPLLPDFELDVRALTSME